MREATARGPSIDITEFERRLRGAEPGKEKRSADPLAELARLLHGEEGETAADPYGRVFSADQRSAEAPRRPAAQPAPPPPVAPAYHEPAYHDEYHAAELRGSLPPQPTVDPQAHYHYPADQTADAGWSHHESQDYLDYGLEPDAYDQYEEEEAPRGFFSTLKSKLRPWHAVAGIAAIGAVSVGWGFAHRNGVIAPREIATINAPEGPAKVQPNTVAEAASPQRGATILDRNESAPVKKVVSHEEQPVDPTAAARVVRLGDGPVDAPHEAPPPAAAEPKRVKTVSVRPDGTVIDNDAQAPAIARPAPPPPQRAAAVGVNPFSIAGLDASSPTVTPKSPAKPATTPQTAQQPPRAKPEKPAAEKTIEKNAPERTASIDAPAADDAGGGGFAVQFGAAGSEAEARQLLQTIASKYRTEIGGRKPGYRIAKVGEKTVYRVRVAGMTKETAVGVCEKVKAAGGNCFVAGN